MKRFRVGTLMLLVVIAALGVGMIAQEMRHRRREAELQAQLVVQMKEWTMRNYVLDKQNKELRNELERRSQSLTILDGVENLNIR
jgi:hypothetical protein